MDKINYEKLKSVLYPTTVFVLFIAGWEFWVKTSGINRITLPSPTDILEAMLQNPGYLFENFWITATESFLGFLLGATIAFGIAVLFVYSRNAKNTFYPFAIALKATPLIALAPLIVLWFGNTMLPMIIMSALIAFFPILVNSVDGLERVEREKIELFKTFKGTKLAEFLKLRLPNSLPLIFSSLKIASTLAVVGAIIGEFTGSGAGLGFVIVNASYYLDIPLMFAAIALSALWGIIFFAVITGLGKKVLFFQRLTAR